MSQKAIKSVRRVFEILELFDQERRPLAAKEVAKRLDYPLVSAHALLKSIHELGYADFDPPNWTYIPSRSFVSVLDWVPDLLEREGQLLSFAEELNQATRETINISRQINTNIRIIYGLESLHPVGVSVKVGVMMPIPHSLTGITALASLPDAGRDQFLKRLRAQDSAQFAHLDIDMIDTIGKELSEQGTVTRCDLLIPGVGAVCMPVKTIDGHETLVVGVVGPSDRIIESQAEHRKTLKRLAKSFQVKTVFKLR